jgi:hypothetical protein
MSTSKPQPVFVLRLRAKDASSAIRELRVLLKRALRSHGFVCLSAVEEREGECEGEQP